MSCFGQVRIWLTRRAARREVPALVCYTLFCFDRIFIELIVGTMLTTPSVKVKSAESLRDDDDFNGHRGHAKSLPALIHDEKTENGDLEDRNETIRSFAESSKHLGHPPPIIFRHSSTERIIIDDEWPSSGRDSENRLRVPGDDPARPVSVQSQYSTEDPTQLKAITLTWTNITVRAGEPSRYAKMKRYFSQCNKKRGTPYSELQDEKVRILKNGMSTRRGLLLASLTMRPF